MARDDVLYGGLGIGSCHSSLSAGRAESLPVGPSRPTHKREPLGSKLMEWLRAHPASPLTSVLQTRHWSESPFGLTVMRSSTVLANVFNNYALELFDLTIVELYERYAKIDPQQLIFAAPLGNIQSTYFDIDESVRILDELLHRQCRGDTEIVNCFLSDLLDVLEKRVSKKNTFFVVSPSNGGKNFFLIV